MPKNELSESDTFGHAGKCYEIEAGEGETPDTVYAAALAAVASADAAETAAAASTLPPDPNDVNVRVDFLTTRHELKSDSDPAMPARRLEKCRTPTVNISEMVPPKMQKKNSREMFRKQIVIFSKVNRPCLMLWGHTGPSRRCGPSSRAPALGRSRR